jgi:hypothetical protein
MFWKYVGKECLMRRKIMANNRMYLVHVPSGLATSIGKRMDKWNARCSIDSIQQLFDTVELEYGDMGDDYAIALEDANGATLATDEWEWSGNSRHDGLLQFNMKIE